MEPYRPPPAINPIALAVGSILPNSLHLLNSVPQTADSNDTKETGVTAQAPAMSAAF